MVDAGGVLLVVALWRCTSGVRERTGARSDWPRRTYRSLIGLMLASIPVGLVLAQVRG